MKTQLFGSLLLLFVFPFLSHSANPVYGVVSTPSDYPNQFDANEYSYIQESFPQLISIAGGNSVYIPYDLSDSQLIPILDAVDGVIFVGGGAQYWSESNTGVRQFTPFMLQIQKIIQYIQEQNNNGRYLPLVGICQGMEVTLMALTNNPYLLDTFVDSTDHGALNITEEGMQSRMFAAIQPKEADFLRANGTLFYNHQFGYNLSSLDNYPDLKANLTLTATAHDYNGKVYMAAVEANDWPMYIMMFHSEYILWEQQNGAFNHSAQDMQLVFSEATFFMEEAQNDVGNTAPKDVLDNWYFSQYEPLDIRAGHPKIYLAKGGNMVNTKKLTTAEAMSPEAFVTIQN